MRSVRWKVFLATAPLITAVAAIVSAVLGESGISWIFEGIRNSQNEQDLQESSHNSEKNIIEFYCNDSEGSLSTMVFNSAKDDPIQLINWDLGNDYFGEDWPPSKRCFVVSHRFQTLYSRDRLAYLTVDIANWDSGRALPVVCGVKSEGARCQEEDLLFTLQDQDDPNQVLTDLIALRQEPTTNKALLRGGESSFSDGVRIYYDLEDILADSSSSDIEEPAF